VKEDKTVKSTNEIKRSRRFNVGTPFAFFKPLKRETKILFFILCVLVGLYGVSFLYRPSSRATFSGSLFPAQDFGAVQEIRFSIPSKAEPVEMGKMTLTKSGNKFYLRTANGIYPVRQQIIDRFFSLLGVSRSFTAISEKPRDYPYYALEDERAARITLVRNDKTILADLFFGAADAVGSGRYVRTGRSVKVFLIDNGIEPFLTIAAPFWLDLQIYAALFRGTSIQALEYGNRFAIRDEANEAAFRSLELFLEKFSCIDVYSAPALQNPQTVRAHLTLGDGSERIFSFSPLQSGDYVFFDTRSSNAYLISGYTCSQLIRQLEAVFPA